MIKQKLPLTDERKAVIQSTFQEWLETGLSTNPAAFDVAEQAITALYAGVGKPRPHFVRLSSPLAAELYINLFCRIWPAMAKGDQLMNQLRGQLGEQLKDQLWYQLRGQLKDQLWDQLWGQSWDQLGEQLGEQLRDQLRGQLRGQLGGQNLRYMGTWFWGVWDYLWMWLDGGRRVGAVYPNKLDAALTHHVALCRSIGWWYPFSDFCIITDRPAAIRLDDAGRIHSPNKMAIEYRDGTGLYAWHGTRAPAEWFKGKLPTAAQALQWPNAEQRRVACEMLGWAKILRELNSREIDRHVNPLIGTLVEATLPENGPQRFLRVQCGTGREFALCVPNTVKTAIEAQSLIQRIPLEMVERIEVRT